MTSTDVPGDAAASRRVDALATASVEARKSIELAANRLCQNLVDGGFHPVIIFGGTSSGKTALILSLVRYFYTHPSGVTLSLDASFFPKDYPERDVRIAEAYTYLETIFQEFKKGVSRKTNATRPIFLPVRIIANESNEGLSDHVRVVIIDGMGEWNEANPSKRGSDGSWLQDFQPEVKAIISSENVSGISAIFVAPHSIDDLGAPPQEHIVAGLASVIDKYRRERTNESRDWNLFLLTKWDLATKAKRRENIFDPDPEFFTKELRIRARDAWARFYNGEKVPKERRYVMQYVSVLSSNGSEPLALPTPGSENAEILNQYSKILINWIYANAAESATGQRVSLFPEVDAFRNDKMPFYDRVLGWISGVRLS